MLKMLKISVSYALLPTLQKPLRLFSMVILLTYFRSRKKKTSQDILGGRIFCKDSVPNILIRIKSF